MFLHPLFQTPLSTAYDAAALQACQEEAPINQRLQLAMPAHSKTAPNRNSAAVPQQIAEQPIAVAGNSIPQYRLSRTIVSVTDLHREYDEGLGGQMAVKDLEAQFGTAWRRNNTASIF
ncbi:hypothetical protein PsorP6_013133 [Peronosclerospora sorghi]|uniref:Uncharacterized protein n=1 Tax=Peronosclerospora sorghi TaxID=230839 RepID=A0ACC0WFX7_9STRA|nr:hypothetical protein PsorP6_013133 [Peronosclerospora sorghi]